MKTPLIVLSALFALSLPTQTTQADDAAANSVSGTVDWGGQIPKAQRKLAPSAILYIFAKKPGTAHQPPMAVVRFTQPLKFPIKFSLSGQNAMVPGMAFEGPMLITARIAQNGGVMPVTPGDIEGTSKKPLNVGTSDAVIRLDTVK